MTPLEKFAMIAKLKVQCLHMHLWLCPGSPLTAAQDAGNTLFRESQVEAAAGKYEVALGYIETVLLSTPAADGLTASMVRHFLSAFGLTPQIEEARSMKVPCLLNYCACQLRRGLYRDVVRYATEALALEPNNAKALCRRGQVRVPAHDGSMALACLTR